MDPSAPATNAPRAKWSRWKAFAAVWAIALVLVFGSILLWTEVRHTNNRPEPCFGCPGGCPQIGTALAFNPPAESNASGQFWYNFTVGSAGQGVNLGDIGVRIQDGGSDFSSALPWSLEAFVGIGGVIGTYSHSAWEWTFNSSAQLVSGDVLSLYSDGASLSGDYLVVIGFCTVSGAISVLIT